MNNSPPDTKRDMEDAYIYQSHTPRLNLSSQSHQELGHHLDCFSVAIKQEEGSLTLQNPSCLQ